MKEDFVLSETTIEQIGDVIDVGSDVKTIKVGDKVVFTPWGIDPFKTPEGELYYFIPESYEFILATL